jgi:hypothetical protein
MSSGEDQQDPERARFIIMPQGETFDGQERVMSREAYDLQVLAISHSASCGHPGFVPDDYLEHLDGLAIETTITAVELCTIGMWERVHGGYRILDRELVEVSLDHIRQIRAEATQARERERERERETQIHARMARPMVVTPPCAVCQAPAARIELVAPGELPAGWEHWDSRKRDSFLRHHEPERWLLIFTGVAAGNGYGGDPIDAGRAGQIATAFQPPCPSPRSIPPGSTTTPDSARTATPRTATSTGTSPKAAAATVPRGHGKSLDPHWS